MDMFDKFKNTPKDYIPNNTFVGPWQPNNQIVRGADCDHVFIAEGDYSGFIASFKVIYRQEFIKLEKPNNELLISVIDGNTYVRVHLTPEETEPFNYRYPVFSQIEITLEGREVIFSKMSEIKVFNSLSAREDYIDG